MTDHRAKVIDKVIKMKAVEEGERKLGNIEAAEAFATAINRMLIEHELEATELEYAAWTKDDPVIEVMTDLNAYGIPEKKTRIAWQEHLAGVVARAHLCRFLVYPGRNWVTFVGTKSHVAVAEYAYGTLVPAAQKMCDAAYHEYGLQSVPTLGKWAAPRPGFKESWLEAFVLRIAQRFDEERAKAVRQAGVAEPGGSSTALVRLNQALVKATQYLKDKKTKKASGLASNDRFNREGHRQGTEAADRMQIGRKGVGTDRGRRQIGE